MTQYGLLVVALETVCQYFETSIFKKATMSDYSIMIWCLGYIGNILFQSFSFKTYRSPTNNMVGYIQ